MGRWTLSSGVATGHPGATVNTVRHAKSIALDLGLIDDPDARVLTAEVELMDGEGQTR